MTSIYVSVSLLAPTHGEFEYLGRAGRSEAVINGGEMHPFKRILLATMIVGAAACSQEEGNRTVATIQGVDIQQKEVDAYLRFKRVPAEDTARADRLQEDYLERKALAAAVVKSPYIEADLVAAEVEDFRLQMLMSRYFENYLNDVVNDQAVENYYNSHPEEFRVEKAAVAHILLRTSPTMSEAERKVKMAAAQEAFSKAKANEPFEKLAEQYSEDRISAKKGGNLGWIKQGAIDPAFSQQVFALKAGEISEPFVTPFGYHVVKKLEDTQVITVPFEQVKGDIRFKLRQLAKDEEMQRLLKSVAQEES